MRRVRPTVCTGPKPLTNWHRGHTPFEDICTGSEPQRHLISDIYLLLFTGCDPKANTTSQQWERELALDISKGDWEQIYDHIHKGSINISVQEMELKSTLGGTGKDQQILSQSLPALLEMQRSPGLHAPHLVGLPANTALLGRRTSPYHLNNNIHSRLHPGTIPASLHIYISIGPQLGKFTSSTLPNNAYLYTGETIAPLLFLSGYNA